MLLQIFNSFLGWIGAGNTPQQNGDNAQSNTHQQGNPNGSSSNFFTGAHDFVIERPIMIDRSHIINNFQTGKTVLEILLPSIAAGATVDSSARDPPPRCHPNTRQAVRQRLQTWSSDGQRRWNMIWLHGPAGVGKSAVAQTFAEECQARGCFGAAFFFSQLKGFSKPIHVIPTLVYQLAVNVPGYKVLLTRELADDPAILQMAMHIQFRRLILDIVSTLHRASSSARPFVVILDGLDECEGEDAQCGIIEMISEMVRLRSDLPLLWLICSRPESHLKRTFTRTDFEIHCGKEDLIIDSDTRADVDRYLRDRFQDIRIKYQDCIVLKRGETWPDERALTEICDASSGLFALASMAVNYIGDPEHADPCAQLASFLSFIKGIHGVGVKNPLAALDILYTRILADVPVHILPVTLQILGFHSRGSTSMFPELRAPSFPAQVLCNFLHIHQGTFYGSLRKLHSVVNVPAPESAYDFDVTFYHKSFQDYLRDSNRSGKFAIHSKDFWINRAKCFLYWLELFLRDRTCGLASQHLTWSDVDMMRRTSRWICEAAQNYAWLACSEISLGHGIDTDLAVQLCDFDYSLLFHPVCFLPFVNWVHKLDSKGQAVGLGNNFLRTQVHYPEVDIKLLNYLSVVVNSGPVQPASFPIDYSQQVEPPVDSATHYFFIGHGPRACLCCVFFKSGSWRTEVLSLKKHTWFGGKWRNYLDWEEKKEAGL